MPKALAKAILKLFNEFLRIFENIVFLPIYKNATFKKKSLEFWITLY